MKLYNRQSYFFPIFAEIKAYCREQSWNMRNFNMGHAQTWNIRIFQVGMRNFKIVHHLLNTLFK